MNKVLCKSLLALAIAASSAQIATAERITTLSNPLLPDALSEFPISTPPMTAAPIPEPPPVGDGPNPPPEMKGDTGELPHVPSGHADPGTGSRFETVPGDTYKAPILVLGNRRGNNVMQYTEKYPYPNTKQVTIDGVVYQYIDTDSPAPGFPKEKSRFYYGGLPSVKTLSRFFVIAAVVASTIMMAFAAYGVIQGEQNAGAKVTHTAGGLMLLFMAYTIWKLILANMSSFDNQGPWDTINHKAPEQILLPVAVPRAAIPQAPPSPPRSGIPVLPDSGN
jgi:hypothetical protein